MPYVLGLDGGGTKTAAVVMDGARNVLGTGLGGPCNTATQPDHVLRASVKQAAGQALASAGLPPDARLDAVCAGVAGYSSRPRRAVFERLLAETVPAARHRVEPDYVAAYWGATEGAPGIIVIAGTGSAVYGRNAAGRACHMGGHGYLLGDEGGAFSIARAALSAALRHMDGDGSLTPLDRRVMEAMGAAGRDDVIAWVYGDPSPARIAELARAVGQCAAEGDSDAERLLASAGADLCALAERALLALGLTHPGANEVEGTICLMGSAWKLHPAMAETFVPLTNVREPLHDAAYGAGLLALQAEETE